MTTIAAKNYGHKIVLGADTTVTCNDTVSFYESKIHKFRVNNRWLYLGYSGTCDTEGLLKFYINKKLDKVEMHGEETIYSLQSLLLDFYGFCRNSNSTADTGFSALIVFVGKLVYFNRGAYYEIPEGQHMAIGSGANFALGAMDAGAEVKEAIQIACQRDLYSGGEIDVIDLDVPPDFTTMLLRACSEN